MRKSMRLWVLIALVAQAAIVLFVFSRKHDPNEAIYARLCGEEARWLTSTADRYETIADKLQVAYGPNDHGVVTIRRWIADYRRKADLTRKAAKLDFRAIHVREMDNWDDLHREFDQSVNEFVKDQKNRLKE